MRKSTITVHYAATMLLR